MKRKKNLMLLGGIFLCLCLAIGIEHAVKKHVDRISTVDEEILTVDPDAVTRISWTREQKTLTFEKQEEQWKDPEDGAFPVDQEAIGEFLEHFKSVHASFVIEDVEDYEQYGLENPEATVHLEGEEGSWELFLGGYSSMDQKRYITLGSGTVYLIDEDLMEYLSTDRDDFIKNDEVPDYDQVTSFSVSGGNSLHIVYEPEGQDTETWQYYLEEDGAYRPLSTSLAGEYMAEVTSLSLDDYVSYQASGEDLSKYGLDEPELTITVTGSVEEEDTEEEASGSDAAQEDAGEGSDKSYTFYIGKKGSDEVYGRLDGSELIYRLDASLLDTLQEGSYDSLRPREVLNVDWDEAESLTFTLDGEEYQVSFKHGWLSDTCTLDGQEVDMSAAEDAAEKLQIHTFTDEAPARKLELSMTVACKDSPQQEIQIYQYDSEDCLVVSGGETLGKITREQLVNLKEAFTRLVLGIEED